ncbi:MAG: glycosyltransferase family 4 protein [Ginsengibacter sp.]
MKIKLATDFNPRNINAWSGLGVYYAKMLMQAGFEIDYINGRSLPSPFLDLLKIQYFKRVKEEIYSSRFDMAVAKRYARIINRRLPDGAYIFSPNAIFLAHTKQNLKKILYTDATFLNLLSFYPGFSSLTKECQKDGTNIDQLAITNADILIYTSQWAADSAINEYKADPSKVFILPFGANLDFTPSHEEIKKIVSQRSLETHVNLLFLGVVWTRKGVDYAVEVTEILNSIGIPATLHISGIKTFPENLNKKYIIDHGYLSKVTEEGQKKIGRLLAQSSFLIMPSLADCTPVSFSEANAFGLPCLTTNVGGHSSIIENGVNGMIFDREVFVESAVNYISNLREKNNKYRELCFSSFEKYMQKLNWNTIGEKISKLVKSI